MKRFFLYLFLLCLVTQSSTVLAQTPTPLPSGAAMSVEGVLIPGITCGVANDPDPGKAKCCVPKKLDDSILAKIADFAAGKPLIGDFVDPYAERYKAVNNLSQTMDPCMTGGVPSTPTDLANKSCICLQNATSSAILELNVFCEKYFKLSGTSNELQKCASCMLQTGGFYTALGCIPLDIQSFISTYVLSMGIGLAGGIAFLCIIYSAFRMQTSMGNAEAIKKAQENMTACITGLIIVIFSVLILKIIGVDILRIPGFGK
jgi:hypothetical protein